LVKDKNAGLLRDPHNILGRWKNHFSQLLNVQRVNDVRQMEIYTDESLVLEPSPQEVKISIAKFIGYKSPGSDQITEKTDLSRRLNITSCYS
jgi:hypothetical protein